MHEDFIDLVQLRMEITHCDTGVLPDKYVIAIHSYKYMYYVYNVTRLS